MKFGLSLKSENCSLLGQEILKYLEKEQISMSSLAERIGKTPNGLRSICLKEYNPSPDTIEKIAAIIKIEPIAIHQMVYRNKLSNLVGDAQLDNVMVAYETLYELLLSSNRDLPKEERPSESALLDRAFRAVKSLQLPVAS